MDMKRKMERHEEHPCSSAMRSVAPVVGKNSAPEALENACGNVALACALLKAMANEDRLLLLCRLAGARFNVGELERTTGIRQPTLSQQLGVLRQEKLVGTEKEGRHVYYRLADDNVMRLMRALWAIYCVRRPGCNAA